MGGLPASPTNERSAPECDTLSGMGKTDREQNLSKALDFVWPAYELSEARMDSLNRRLEAVMGLGFLAIPAFVAASGGKSVVCAWFLWGTVSLIGSVIACIYGRSKSTVLSQDLSLVRTHGYTKSHVDFCDQMLSNAHCYVSANAKVNKDKARIAICAAILAGVGVVLLTSWLAW